MNQKTTPLIYSDTELSDHGNHPFLIEGTRLVEVKIAPNILPEQLELLRKLDVTMERLKRLTSV